MQFKALLEAVIDRELEWDPDHRCDLSFLGNAMAGECGEACNIIKKLERERLGMKGKRATKTDLSEELADVIIYMAIISMRLDIDLWSAVIEKFNRSSKELGLKTRL